MFTAQSRSKSKSKNISNSVESLNFLANEDKETEEYKK
jgi:hypothetical protein